jgi:23S rRNA (cytidine1920-2'-O)/16S rRNA (cytidine1409-2'-O)-methyltransferase
LVYNTVMSSQKKLKLIDHLLAHGLVNTKEEALRLVMAGNVVGNGRKFHSIHEVVNQNETVIIKERRSKYVSRGGDKLASIFHLFNLEVDEKTGIDLGISTGGFSDFLLQHGAKNIIGIDVGYGILAEKLRQDSRVLSIERTNLRTLTFDKLLSKISEHPHLLPVDFAVGDLSFISLEPLLPIIRSLVKPDGDILLLFKPQFEAAKGEVPEGGVIKDQGLIDRLLDHFITITKDQGFKVTGTHPSGIKGQQGNQEFFIHLRNSGMAP